MSFDIWQSLQKAVSVPDDKQRFGLKIKGLALWAALLHSIAGSGWQAQTQGIFELAAVAADHNWLA